VEELACVQKISSKQQSLSPSKLLKWKLLKINLVYNYLWFLTERNVVLSFFSGKVTLKEKTEMWKKYKN